MTNLYQENTSESKLRGQYYTPAEFVQLILGELRLSAQDRLIDPSCGDGSFLCGAIRALSETVPEEEKPAAGLALAQRLIGFDIDRTAVEQARENLRLAFRQWFGVDVPAASLQVFAIDALQFPALLPLFEKLGLPAPGENERLLVIGNPPYVEAKRLDNKIKQRLKTAYPDALCGAPDLYIYFLHVCLGWLRGQDALAFVLPNKILVNANAQQIRSHLLERNKLAGIWFATQANIFPDAAVYPVVLFARGENTGNAIVLQHIERDENTLTSAPSATIPDDIYLHTEVKALFPFPKQPQLRGLLERMLIQHDRQRLDDVCDIRWCVSFHRAGLREKYVTRSRPDSRFAKMFLGGGAFAGNGDVTRYAIQWSGWWIDYNEDVLRNEDNGLPALAMFTQPKIVICQNGRTIRAAYDESGYILKDTFLCGVVKEEKNPSTATLTLDFTWEDAPVEISSHLSKYPRAIVGILNSKLIHFFYSHVFYGGHVNDGYLHFLSAFLVDIPLGDWTADSAARLEALVQRRERTTLPEEQLALEREIDRSVGQSFALTPIEDEMLQGWIDEDENWQARDRIRRS